MQQTLNVYFLPTLVAPDELAGATTVVIDVLRASTTICHALAAGVREVIPCLEVHEARRIAANLGPPRAVLGGERGGVRIEGFDLGNSPGEFRPETVGGRTVVFTTTNGTRAMNQCRAAARVLIGSFVNLSAVCEQLPAAGQICLICASTDDRITREDVLCTGAIVEYRLASGAVDSDGLNDQARIACETWRATVQCETPKGGSASREDKIDSLTRTLRETEGGRNLVAVNLTDDLAAAAQIDALQIVPELDLTTWRITASAPSLAPNP